MQFGWWRPTFVMGDCRVEETPLGRTRIIIAFDDGAHLSEGRSNRAVTEQPNSRFGRFIGLQRHRVLHLLHYLGFKLRKPFKPFRTIHLGERDEGHSQSRLQARDRGNAGRRIGLDVQEKGHGHSPQEASIERPTTDSAAHA